MTDLELYELVMSHIETFFEVYTNPNDIERQNFVRIMRKIVQ